MTETLKDLVILVADKDMEESIKALLSRPEALGIRPVDCDIYVHPYRDPGCLGGAEEFLRFAIRSHAHALVLFDREGCGSLSSVEALAQIVQAKLANNGWRDQCAVIVLDPELEVWVWSDSPHVDEVLGWRENHPPLREWLGQQGYVGAGENKPSRPKEAMEEVLRAGGKPRSSSLYRQLAERVSLRGHQEPAFLKLCAVLQGWFPRE